MAQLKKNALGQVLFPEVDSTDFATIKSALTNVPTAKFFGVNHGGSAAVTSGSISKAISHVHSGIYRMTMKAAETNYDYVLYRIVQPSCADQILTFQPLDNDDSDIMSALLVIQSMASDAASAAQQGNSRVILCQSRISDVQSFLSDFQSDLISHIDTTGVHINASDMSDIRSAIAGGAAGALTVSDISDIASAVWANTIGARVDSRILLAKSVLSDIYSAVSDMQSDFQSRVPKRVATDSQLSDMASDIKSLVTVANSRILVTQSAASDAASAAQQGNSRVLLCQSRISDVQSFLSDFQSDLISHLDTTGVGLNASTMSDIRSSIRVGPSATITVSDLASAVWADPIGARVDSRMLVTSSGLSDVYSLLSDFQSDLMSHLDTTGVGLNASTMSDLRSAINGLTVSLDASNISDIASAVVAALPVVSMISDIYSMLSDFRSDFQSRVPKLVATNSQVSDLVSDVKSAVTIVQSMASDAASAAQQTNSRVLLNQSRISDIQSFLSDFQSDLNSFLSDFKSDLISHLDTTGVHINASDMSDIRSAIAATTFTLGASDLSDIGSAVWANTIGARVDSRILLAKSSLSDVYSAITAGVELGASSISDIRSAIAATTFTLDASSLSDIASAVWAKAGADPTSVPAVTGTMQAKIDWLTAMSRQKVTQTATTQVVRNDGDTGTIGTAAVSDDGTTFTRGKFS